MAKTVSIDQWLDFARKSVIEVNRDNEASRILSESLGSIMSQKIPKWYGVTDLINPARKYYELQFPEIPEDSETIEKFRMGNEVQDIAFQWFREIERTVVKEVEVNGETLGLPEVRGRLDFSLSQSIVEFKTTHHKILKADDVLVKNPQDLEQLCIYALLSRRTDEEHYLVYFSEDYENSFRVFRLKITDPTYLTVLIRERAELLSKSLKDGSPDKLGRCRYFDFGCKFKTNNICDCEHLTQFDTTSLRSKMTLERDRDLEVRLYHEKEITPDNDQRWFSLWDLVTPRKVYLRNMKLLDEEPAELDKGNAEIFRDVNLAISNSEYYVERRELSSNGYSLGNTIVVSMKLDPKSRTSTTRLYPTVARVYLGPPSNIASGTISSYYLLRLAMVCSLAGSDSGYLMMGFKEDKRRLDSYRVRFSKLGELKSWIDTRLAELSFSLRNHDPGGLPTCPDFLMKSCGKNCLCRFRG